MHKLLNQDFFKDRIFTQFTYYSNQINYIINTSGLLRQQACIVLAMVKGVHSYTIILLV